MSKSKKQRISQACLFCRSRHLKCNGEKTCFQCQSRDLECIYPPKRKRGPKPKKQQIVKRQKEVHVVSNDTYPVFFVRKVKQERRGMCWLDFHEEEILEYYNVLKVGDYKIEMDRLVKAFGHAVVFAQGAQLFGFESQAVEMADKAVLIVKKLIFKCNVFVEEISGQAKLLEEIILLSEFYYCYLMFNKTKFLMSQALTLIQLKEFPSDLVSKVYSFFVVSSFTVEEKLIWFEKVGNPMNIYTRMHCILSLPSTLDIHQRYIQKPMDTQEIQFILEATKFIDATEDLFSSICESMTEEDQNSCKLIIYGTRSFLYTKLGQFEISLSWADEGVLAYRFIAHREVTYKEVIALGYIITSSLLSGNLRIFELHNQTFFLKKKQWPILESFFNSIQELSNQVLPVVT